MTRDESSDLLETEIDRILEKIGNQQMQHVPESERRSSVRRAIEQIGISSKDSVETLLQNIDTNEEQITIHAQPSD